jgi:hypothetical protein
LTVRETDGESAVVAGHHRDLRLVELIDADQPFPGAIEGVA